MEVCCIRIVSQAEQPWEQILLECCARVRGRHTVAKSIPRGVEDELA